MAVVVTQNPGSFLADNKIDFPFLTAESRSKRKWKNSVEENTIIKDRPRDN